MRKLITAIALMLTVVANAQTYTNHYPKLRY